MFHVGELVYYPMHGIGTVEAITEQSVLGETAQYYVLRLTMGRMEASVPVKSADTVGLRPPVSPEEAYRIVEYLQTDEIAHESDNWNQRFRDNTEKLKNGSIRLVAEVVKCLLHRDSEKSLSTGERKMLITARQVLLAELCAATGKSEDEFLPLVDG